MSKNLDIYKKRWFYWLFNKLIFLQKPTFYKVFYKYQEFSTKLKKFLVKDILENNVNEKYFIRQESMKKAIENNKLKIIQQCSYTITTKQMRWGNAGIIVIPNDIKKINDGKLMINLRNYNQVNIFNDMYTVKINHKNLIKL